MPSSSDYSAFFQYVIAPIIGIVVLLLGFLFKRKAPEHSAEDTVYRMMSDTITRLNEDLRGRDATITQLMNDIIAMNANRSDAEAIAVRAQSMAELAEENAKRATDAAKAAMQEVRALREARARDNAYIAKLKHTLSEAGINIPEPEEDLYDLDY